MLPRPITLGPGSVLESGHALLDRTHRPTDGRCALGAQATALAEAVGLAVERHEQCVRATLVAFLAIRDLRAGGTSQQASELRLESRDAEPPAEPARAASGGKLVDGTEHGLISREWRGHAATRDTGGACAHTFAGGI